MSIVTIEGNVPDNGHFTDEECDRIIEFAKTHASERGEIQKSEMDARRKLRSVESFRVPWNDQSAWIFERLIGISRAANDKFFGFDIPGLYSAYKHRSLLHYVEVLRYEPGDRYVRHMDYGPIAVTRKLSLITQLSDPGDYEGGDVMIDMGDVNPFPASRDRGAHTIFPSFLLHEVMPVTRGRRWALVAWMEGPPFR